MAKTVTIAGTDYTLAELGDEGWGEDMTDIIDALVGAVTGTIGPADISETTDTISNNVTGYTDINGLLFDTAIVRGASIHYSIYRLADLIDKGETGEIKLTYINNAASGSKWEMSQNTNGDSGVTISVTDLGQVQYISDSMASTGSYTGKITFRAKGFLS